jgi:hypothetical protein
MRSGCVPRLSTRNRIRLYRWFTDYLHFSIVFYTSKDSLSFRSSSNSYSCRKCLWVFYYLWCSLRRSFWVCSDEIIMWLRLEGLYNVLFFANLSIWAAIYAASRICLVCLLLFSPISVRIRWSERASLLMVYDELSYLSI